MSTHIHSVIIRLTHTSTNNVPFGCHFVFILTIIKSNNYDSFFSALHTFGAAGKLAVEVRYIICLQDLRNSVFVSCLIKKLNYKGLVTTQL